MAITEFPINTTTFEELEPITDAQSTDADGVMLYDDSVGVMKRMTKGDLFKGKVIPIDDITGFLGIDYLQVSDRQQYHMNSFAPGGESGGGSLMWSSTLPKILHDGVRYFSPTVPMPADFDNEQDVQDYKDGVGEEFPADLGVFVLTSFSIQSSEYPAVDGAIVLFDGISGNRVKNGPVPSEIGASLIEFPPVEEVSYHRLNADGTVTARSTVEHKTDLQLNNVDNTSDADKPISDATQAALSSKAGIIEVDDALALKADLASPALTGNPTAPTPAADDDSKSIATTQYVQGELSDRIQSVATIADLESLAGLTDGQVIYVNEYEAGFKDGGGEFVVDSAATEGQIITTIDGAKCVRRSDIYKAESWGAHSSRANNAPYFQAAADTVGRIDGKRGVIYKFTDQVSLTSSFEFNGNKCQVEFGDGHANLFNLVEDVGYVRIRDVANTIIKGTSIEDYCYKNFYSSFANTGTVIGFPTGVPSIAQTTLIENCVINEARIFSAGSVEEGTTLTVNNARCYSNDYIVRPCLIYASGHAASTISDAFLDCKIYEDIIKASPGTGFTLRDSTIFQRLGTREGSFTLGQIDVYAGPEASQIYGNKLHNIQVHRKQTGGAGPVVDAGRDSIRDNIFYITGFAGSAEGIYPVYWRGWCGSIQDNKFHMRLDSTYAGLVRAILLDEESPAIPPYNQTHPTGIKISGNMFDFIACGGSDRWAIGIDSGTGALNDLQRDITNNTLYAGDRFVSGETSIFAMNTWHTPASTAPINARISYGNDMPAGVVVTGAQDGSLREFAVPLAGIIDATYSNFCRSADGVNITSISGGRQGQTMVLYARNAVTVIHSASLMLRGSANAAIPVRGFMTFIKTPAGDGEWAEISRSF